MVQGGHLASPIRPRLLTVCDPSNTTRLQRTVRLKTAVYETSMSLASAAGAWKYSSRFFTLSLNREPVSQANYSGTRKNRRARETRSLSPLVSSSRVRAFHLILPSACYAVKYELWALQRMRKLSLLFY